MQPYKAYFIEGTAIKVHPFSPDWHVAGVLRCPNARVLSVIQVGSGFFIFGCVQIAPTTCDQVRAPRDNRMRLAQVFHWSNQATG